ncbi:putative ion transporter superfamily protein YfcC [Lutibacter oceani]|uniref:Putative ion transporter superfamily protein YfcC n=1 Tax=Lutibacter oceani TaxID=1853311 RepID=A0A3D9RUN7_9FLAO|nr:Na+/H+ antiporter NhaC family protein [Lutibacter oceani]REE83683.1 putative ion transporter superfamily protein YfcC [Lutibacter oceani]
MKKFPNALVIMIGFIILSTILTYIIPQGQYERVTNPDTNQISVVEGSYKPVDAEPVSILKMFLSIPEGVVSRASLITLILLIGGCFYVIEKTGALKEGITFLTIKLQGKEEIILIIVATIFLVGGAIMGLQEEIIAMIPVLLYLTSRLGYNAFVAIAISFGSAILGAAFSPMNPFAVVIAQKETGLEFLSGSGFRLIVLAIAFIVWMFMVIKYANKNKIEKVVETDEIVEKISIRSAIILSLVGMAFVILVIGMLNYNWDFNEMSAEFFALGIIVGLIGNLGVNGTIETYIEGFKELVFAAMIVGFASSISIILKEGMVIDSIIYGLFTPMQYLPKSMAAISMMISQAALHFPVTSYSGQAILTMPILAPLSDLIGISRQVCVLAYQYGAVMTDLIYPTQGALMAIIAIAGISFDKWFKFILKFVLTILLVGAIAIVVAVYIGF